MPDQAFRFANYVCHRKDKQTTEGGTAILVRCGIVHHSVPVPGLTHLEATAVQVTLTGTPPIDRSETDRLFRLGIAFPYGRRSQRQTRGLELAADPKTGEIPTGIRQ